jgi:amidohydrolase
MDATPATAGSVRPQSWPQPAAGADPLPRQLDAWLDHNGSDLVAIRRHLHAHPELSHREFETTAFLEAQLQMLGLTPQLLPAGNGIICDIEGDSSVDRMIALRADIDALPLPDTKDVPYRSTVSGVAHACGHDVHATVLLGTAKALSELARVGELPGRVRLLFQPAEEQMPSGAPKVIEAGGLTGVDAIYALHCAPQLPVGLVGVRSGPFTAAADMVEVKLRGAGGHTARPHLTADLVHALSKVVIEVPNLLSRRIDPRAGVCMVFGSIRAGEAANAIPIEGSAMATVRALSKETWQQLPDVVTQLIHDVVAGTGAEVTVRYQRGVPPVVNDRMATAIVAGAAGAALGADRVVEAEMSMGGEDFACYLQEVPGAMFRLGCGVPGSGQKLDIHQSSFDVDEKAIGYGVRVMTHTALAALSTGAF